MVNKKIIRIGNRADILPGFTPIRGVAREKSIFSSSCLCRKGAFPRSQRRGDMSGRCVVRNEFFALASRAIITNQRVYKRHR